MNRPRALLFDLGNVIIEIDFARVLAHWQSASSLLPAELAAAFGFDAPYQQHEAGALAAPGYFAHLRERLQLQCDDEAVRAGWNRVFVRPIAQTVALVEQVAARVPCYALSNTNAPHLEEMRRAFPQALAPFRQVFASHEIGHRKPQPAAFEHVLAAMGVAASDVLFFDDTLENVEGARGCGIESVLVGGPEDVRAALVERGLVE